MYDSVFIFNFPFDEDLCTAADDSCVDVNGFMRDCNKNDWCSFNLSQYFIASGRNKLKM